MSAKPKCHILLCAPRGFCAGVDRAIQIVEEALQRFGAPVYVRHEIVHNRYVVDSLKAKGAVFVEELDEMPGRRSRSSSRLTACPKACRRARPRATSSRSMRPVRSSPRSTRRRSCITGAGARSCWSAMPGTRRWWARWVSCRRAPSCSSRRRGCARAFSRATRKPRLRDADDAVGGRHGRDHRRAGGALPRSAPHREDICYATTNRQEAVKRVAPRVERMIVVGAQFLEFAAAARSGRERRLPGPC